MGMLCAEPVDDCLAIFRHVRELPAVATSHVLATCTEPQSFLFKVSDQLLVEMPAIQIMQSPPIVIAFLCAAEIPETQARLRPPKVVLGSMDPAEHHCLVKGPHQVSALFSVSPMAT